MENLRQFSKNISIEVDRLTFKYDVVSNTLATKRQLGWPLLEEDKETQADHLKLKEILEIVRNRLFVSLKNLSLNALKTGLRNIGKSYSNPYAQQHRITIENSFINLDSYLKTAKFFNQNEVKLNEILKKCPPTNKLFSKNAQKFLKKIKSVSLLTASRKNIHNN